MILAVVSGDTVYPVNTKFTQRYVNGYDAGPVLVYSNPEDVNHEDYDVKNIIDFENVENPRDAMRKSKLSC